VRLAAALLALAAAPAVAQVDPPSAATIAHNKAAAAEAPFADTRDLEFAERGFLGTRKDPVIRAADGHVVLDLRTFDFVRGAAPATVNPSLWRESGLIARHGLFRVTDRIWQVRGFDVSNVTFVKGDSGWVVIDTGTVAETTRAAYDLVTEKLGRRPVVAIVYTHSHADHYGGAEGLRPFLAPGAPVIAPVGFLKAAISENVIAGPAMGRRAAFQFGMPLERNPTGTVGSGIGAVIPNGTRGMIPPTREITETGTELTLDGVRVKFQLTLGTEAPAEMNLGFPDWRVVDMAENANVGLHNILTPRGAVIRSAKAWADGLNDAIGMFPNSEIMIVSHGWPRFGASEVADYLGKHRDLYAFLHDQTVRMMNQGLTGDEIAARLTLPASLRREWYDRPYYGSLSFNARAVYQYYMGWYDANPVHLAPLPSEEGGKRYVAAMGGAAHVRDMAEAAYDGGDYAWAAELLNRAVFADPEDAAAKALLARCYDQLAWQSENSVWRNIYRTGATELRGGVAKPLRPGDGGLLPLLPTADIFDLLATRLDPAKVGDARTVIAFVFPERGEQVAVSVANGVLTHRAAVSAKPDATVTIKRADLVAALTGAAPLAPRIASGEVRIEGDRTALADFAGWFDRPDPSFAIVTP
jgi:alkyl sulfatase BDS1-like metallo-beta-lactamase superfamily hydrolase